MMNASLSQFDDATLDEATLSAVCGGFGWSDRSRGRRFDVDIDVNVEINIISIRGDQNVVAGRDASIFGRR